MKLADKIRYLREVEGSLRGLGRAMSQGELVKAIASETGESLSQSYLSQIESGARPHLTNNTRLLLAKFFKVHPGYLVDDPEGYHAELLSDVRLGEDTLDIWLVGGAERFRRDPELRRALLAISRHPDSRRCLLLLEGILETGGLVERLMEVLAPETARRSVVPGISAGASAELTRGSVAETDVPEDAGELEQPVPRVKGRGRNAGISPLRAAKAQRSGRDDSSGVVEEKKGERA